MRLSRSRRTTGNPPFSVSDAAAGRAAVAKAVAGEDEEGEAEGGNDNRVVAILKAVCHGTPAQAEYAPQLREGHRNTKTMISDKNNRTRIEAYEARCAQYRALGYDRSLAARWVVEQAGILVGPAMDIGTGKGSLAIELARIGLDVASVDVDKEEQALAALLAEQAGVGDRICFLHGNATRLPFPDGHFGCACMMDVLHHLERPLPILHEMARVVRKGGCLVIADFDESGFEVVRRVLHEEGREHPRSPFTIEMAVKELVSYGFRLRTQAEGCFHRDAVLVKPEE